MEYPVIEGQRYRVQHFGTATITEAWGDYIINGVLDGDTILFSVTDYAGEKVLEEVSFLINGEEVTTTEQAYTFNVTDEKTVTAHGDNIKGATIFIPKNAAEPQTIEDLQKRMDQLVIVIGDMLLSV